MGLEDSINVMLPDNIKKFDREVQRLGWKKSLLYYFLLYLVPVGLIAYITNRQVSTINKQVVNVTQSISGNGQNEKQGESTKQNSGEIAGKSVSLNSGESFNEQDWIIDKSKMKVDKDGYYCREKGLVRSSFPIWSLWTKKTFRISTPVDFTLLVRPIGKQEEPATVSITYGQYKEGLAPQTIYRLDLFDTDMQTVRLYNDKNDASSPTGRLSNEPNIANDITIALDPKFGANNDRTLFVNPKITYAVKDRPSNVPDDLSDMKIVVPSVDSSVEYQYGIGIKEEFCVKILSNVN